MELNTDANIMCVVAAERRTARGRRCIKVVSPSNPSVHLARPCAIFDRPLAFFARVHQLNGAPQQPPHLLPMTLGPEASLCFPACSTGLRHGCHVVQACAVSCGEAKQLVWVLRAFEISCPLSIRPSTAPLGAGGARPSSCEDGVPTRRVGAALAVESGNLRFCARRLPES